MRGKRRVPPARKGFSAGAQAPSRTDPKNALSSGKAPKDPPKTTGIRLQLILVFLAFTVIIISLLWVFQVLLLNRFYEGSKVRAVKRAAAAIVESFPGEESLTDTVKGVFTEHSIYTRICDKYGRTRLVWPREDFRLNQISYYSQRDLIKLYGQTAEAPEMVVTSYDYVNPYKAIIWDSDDALQDRERGVILRTVHTTPAGESYLILLETEITPLDATTDTLKVQLIDLSVLMLLLGVGLALLLARQLSGPIISINDSAKLLARGDYDIHFPAAGCRETRELAQTLNYAAGELSKVEHLRRELIANVSHDLRTPLTMIKGYGEVMRDLPGENNPENIQVIIDEATRLSDLVNDLLDLSKLEADAAPLSPVPFNLTKSIHEILRRYDKLADFHFEFRYEEEAVVYGDPLKISQVIYNLVNNAINYTGPDKDIRLTQLLQGDKVRISISDSGQGIPEDQLKDIWERYYKVDKTHHRGQTGTGLGLSIVKNILHLHGGGYGVQSTLGVGSTFWFELPLADPETQ